ncbi:MAG: hypothetical protein ACO1OB_31400 [Archangium sp.]
MSTLCIGLCALVASLAPEQPDGGTSKAAHVRALVAEALDPSIDPQSLFPVALTDEAALRLEAVRAAAFIRVAETTPGELEALGADELRELLDLERARLVFYALPAERRRQLLAHATARLTGPTVDENGGAGALRSQTAQRLATERSRLLALQRTVAALRENFRAAAAASAARQDEVLGWQRRVDEARGDPRAADATYDALRVALKSARGELDASLDTLTSSTSQVPAAGPDALADLPVDAPTGEVRTLRAQVEGELALAEAEEREGQRVRAAALLREIDVLNAHRLGLLEALSSRKRDAVTGFTEAGFDQARSEARHLTLIVRYQTWESTDWLRAVRGGRVPLPLWQTLRVLLPWLVLLVVFLTFRRRSVALVRAIDFKFRELDRADGRATPSPARRLSRMLIKTHRSLEWAAFFSLSLWLLPNEWQSQLEVELVLMVLGWSIVASLIVDVINALAASSADEEAAGAALRLGSLRLVGRTAVGFVVFLAVTARLVGEGTLYSWVFSTCWLAAVPMALVLVNRWRPTIHDRLLRLKKRSKVQAWVLTHRQGALSFPAAVAGALNLFARGAERVARNWLTRFDIVRRGHAYLFRRELSRQGGGAAAYTPLDAPAREALHPARPPPEWLASPADAALTRIASRTGGVLAIVAPRGMGKTSLLGELARRTAGSVMLDCAAVESGALLPTIDGESKREPPLVLLDDAHALVKPTIGGLARFDAAIALARARCLSTTWVFAFDASIWPLVRRARDARPLFDEVLKLEGWNERQIGALLADRSARAGLAPSYDTLLEGLMSTADEQARAEELQERQVAYERMLWDHVGGIPAVALEVWRSSLATTPGGAVSVRPLQVPDARELERLPDASLFVLRAILQLAAATVPDLAEATRLSEEQVLNAVTFGRARGFLLLTHERVDIAWPWLRPVTRLLERRHLLVNA